MAGRNNSGKKISKKDYGEVAAEVATGARRTPRTGGVPFVATTSSDVPTPKVPPTQNQVTIQEGRGP
ncbi:hypothetical protein MRX96_018575 [Rhipicephalus microplus]